MAEFRVGGELLGEGVQKRKHRSWERCLDLILKTTLQEVNYIFDRTWSHGHGELVDDYLLLVKHSCPSSLRGFLDGDGDIEAEIFDGDFTRACVLTKKVELIVEIKRS